MSNQEIIPGQIYVIKRNGDRVDFELGKVSAALNKVFVEVDGVDVAGSENTISEIEAITNNVKGTIERRLVSGGIIHIEDIQDAVELALMRMSRHQIARAYVLYREKRKNERQPEDKVNQGDTPSENTLEFKIRKILDDARTALNYSEQDVDLSIVFKEAVQGVYNNITDEGIRELVVLSLRSCIEKGIEYSYIAAQVAISKSFQDSATVLGTSEIHIDETNILEAYINKGVELNRLDPKLLDFNLGKLAKTLKQERNKLFTYLSYTTLYDRYFIHHNNLRYETPQCFWMRVAMGLAINEGSNKNERAIEFYDVLSQMDYMSSTPTLFNAGTIRPQLSSCFLTTIPDDLEGIYDGLKDNAMLSKWSGGLGNDWTPVRALNSYIAGTNGKSQGVIPFLKVSNDTAVAVNQGGKRKGAFCAYLETWHLDIEEFLELRKNTGDDRRRTHDMNTANWIPDLFMVRVLENKEWTLFTPSEVTDLHDLYGKEFDDRYTYYESIAKSEGMLHKVVKAKDLWRKMLSMLFETGHPWLTFKDPCNIRSPQQHVGVVHSSNLCTEITLNTAGDEIAVCNLGSINLVNHIVDDKFDLDKLRITVRKAIRMLDNVIDVNFYPVPEAANSNMKHRPIGLGIMGFQDALYKLGIKYNSDEAVEFSDWLMEHISFNAIKASSELAIEKGAYPTFEGSLWSKGIFPLDTVLTLKEYRGDKYFYQDTSSRINPSLWADLKNQVVTSGMRNSNVMAIAPTATISNICGVSQSIEPTFQNLYVKSNLSGEFTIINDYLVKALKERGLWNQQTIDDLKRNDGELGSLSYIPTDIKEMFLTAFSVDPKFIIESASRRQKWIDQAQSLNLYISGVSGQLLDLIYTRVWLLALKTTYYLRALSATQTEKSTVDSNALRSVAVEKPVAVTKTEDFTAGVAAAPVPQACSIDNPDCEACQ